MGNPVWVFVPVAIVSLLCASALLYSRRVGLGKVKNRLSFNYFSIVAAFFGGIFFVLWFLQMVVDIGAVK